MKDAVKNARPGRTLLTLVLVLALSAGMCAPARAAGFWSWLTGDSDDTAAVEAGTVLEWPDDTPAPAETTVPGETAEPAETPAAEPAMSPEPAAIPDSALTDDGLLRVYLRSLNLPRQLNLTLAGVYAVESDPDFRFVRDTQVTLTAADGKIYLSVGGLTLSLGGKATFTRHRAAEGMPNGITIEESEKDALYCGDLTVSIENGGLRAVVTLPVEEYLYGVVGYEMSDAFPIEALKAQAVAARTYAMQRKWSAGTRDYDVVDTTADQVYKGYDASFTNVIQAVNDTCGVVGVYNGGFPVCYYTASNGGQTALASQIWGGTDSDGYLAMADDPYDLENPRSLQNDLTIGARCEGSAALKAMLEEALGAEMAKAGFEDGQWQFDSIAAVEPVNPRFEGSRMFDGLAFDLRAKVLSSALATPEPTGTPEPAGTPEPGKAAAKSTIEATEEPILPLLMPTDAPTAEPTEAPEEWVLSEDVYRVTLDTYDQIKDRLSLGLNGGNYELVSVETEADARGQAEKFTIVMRRFGHGVGMSQRGAQWMAGHYGMAWTDILAFY